MNFSLYAISAIFDVIRQASRARINIGWAGVSAANLSTVSKNTPSTRGTKIIDPGADPRTESPMNPETCEVSVAKTGLKAAPATYTVLMQYDKNPVRLNHELVILSYDLQVISATSLI